MKRFLRSPKTIISELVALAIACSFGAAIPQLSTAASEELSRLQNASALLQSLVRFFSLDHIFTSIWFLAITATAAASLAIVILEQFRRVRILWSQKLTQAHFNSAPFRAEFERPRVGPELAPCRETRIWSERRIGLSGTLVFHVGLLLIMLAGSLRALFSTNAVVDLLETETIAANAQAWDAQFPAVFAKTFALDRPVTLREVKSTGYENGDVRSLSLILEVAGENRELAINRELRVAGGRLFLGHDFGPAALIEWNQGGTAKRERVQLTDSGRGDYEGTFIAGENLRAHIRAHVDAAGNHPAIAEVRVMKGNALVRADDVRIGQTLVLPGGASLTLHGIPFWARIRASSDPSLGLAFAGLILIMLGSTIMFSFIKVDACVIVTPAGDREKVFVALRPQRYAPLFADRFARLLREQGAPA